MFLSLRAVCFPSDILLKKPHFSFTRGYQLELAFWLSMEACVLIPFSCRTPSGADPCRSCACSVSEFLCVHHTLFVLYLESLVSLVPSILCGSYILSSSSSAEFPEPCGETFDGDISLRDEYSKVFHSLNFDCGSLFFFFQLMQEEATLMMAEQNTDLCV